MTGLGRITSRLARAVLAAAGVCLLTAGQAAACSCSFDWWFPRYGNSGTETYSSPEACESARYDVYDGVETSACSCTDACFADVPPQDGDRHPDYPNIHWSGDA